MVQLLGMIRLLANFFRGLSNIAGITAPPAGENDTAFVRMWLGILVFGVAAAFLLFYVIMRIFAA